MSARDDYPEAAGVTLSAYVRQHATMCDEIDRLRSEVDKWKRRFWQDNRLRFDAILEIKAARDEIKRLREAKP